MFETFKLVKEAEEAGYIEHKTKSYKHNMEKEDVSYNEVINTTIGAARPALADIAVGSGIGMGLGTLVGSKIKVLGPGKGAYIGTMLGATPGLAKERYLYMQKMAENTKKKDDK